MKKTNIIYWVITILMALFMGFGGIFDALAVPEAVAYVTKLGYPEYLVRFLGVAKTLGIIAILVPGFPRLKEWAYAGLIFDLMGATYSHIMTGAPAAEWLTMIIPFALVFGSYIFHHKRLKETKTNVSVRQPEFATSSN